MELTERTYKLSTIKKFIESFRLSRGKTKTYTKELLMINNNVIDSIITELDNLDMWEAENGSTSPI